MKTDDITIILPFFNSDETRFFNIHAVLASINKSNISCIVCEQHDGTSEFKETLVKYPKCKIVEYITTSKKINKSKLVNLGVSSAQSKYIWEVDSDIILKWDEVINNVGVEDVIKPFKYVVKLDKKETAWYLANGKIKIKSGDLRETVSKFGPLSFIMKRDIFIRENGMNEEFEGWSWEDIEFARRIQSKYEVKQLDGIRGIHLWHVPAESNEEENKKILDKTQEKHFESKSKEIVSQVDNNIPKEIKAMTSFISCSNTKLEGKASLYNLLSIVIPVKIDSTDRINNLERVLQFFNLNFLDYEIIVVEQDEISKCNHLLEKYKFKHIFIGGKGCFYKTRNFNTAISIASGKYIAAYDCDVIFKPQALISSLNRLVEKKTFFIYPYNSYMLGISKEAIKNIKLDILSLEKLPYINHMSTNILDNENISLLYGDLNHDCTGGCFMFDKEVFFNCGAYNTNIISYGCEDNEIEVRVKKLGFLIERNTDYNCYHIDHARNVDSHYNNFFKNNLEEFNKIKKMDSSELRSYVNNGYLHMIFDSKLTLNIQNDSNGFSIRQEYASNKIDLSDLDIIIPTYIDTNDRYENVSTLIKFINKNFLNHRVHIIEMQSNRCKVLYHNVGINYTFVDKKYNKTSCINIGLTKCDRKYVSIWDVDAIIPPQGIKSSLEALKNKYKIAYPYNGWFIDIGGNTLELFKEDVDYKNFKFFDSKDNSAIDHSVRFSTKNQLGGGGNNGGCVLFDRVTLNELGGYNENFFEWGFEDDEIEVRYEKLDYEIYKSPNANCYHLNHVRSSEENGFGSDYWNKNYKEFCLVSNMTKQDLYEYIGNKFKTPIVAIDVLCSRDYEKDNIKKLCAMDDVLNIFLEEDYSHKKVKTYDGKSYRGKKVDGFFIGDVIVKNPQIEDIPFIKSYFSSNRRNIITKNGSIYAFKKWDYDVAISGNIASFIKEDIQDIKRKDNTNNNIKCSIVFTTYGSHSLMTKEWMDRFVGWKNKDLEIIAVVHDETVLHRLTLEYYKDIGIIDKLIYATHNHGHINGLALASNYCKGEYIAVINNDMLVSKECIDWCIKTLKEKSNIGSIGWHYDNINHRGTFWEGDVLNYKIRPNSNPDLQDKEISKIQSAKWFTNKVFNTIGGFKRLFLPNGSFIFTRTELWKSVGGYCFEHDDHFFHDDWFSYGVLEKGFDIINLPTDWGDSSKSDIFLSKTDYKWRGIEDTSYGVDSILMNVNESESEIIKIVCGNKNVCILGNPPPIVNTIKFNTIKFMGEKCDVMLVYDYVTSFKNIQKHLANNGCVIYESNFHSTFSDLPEGYSSRLFGNIGLIIKDVEREKYIKNKPLFIKTVTLQKKRQKFIVMTQPRVGFNNFKIALDSGHNDIFLDYDIFKKDKSRITHVLQAQKEADINKFMDSYWDLVGLSTGKKCTGFRFNVWDEPTSFPIDCLNDEYKIILIRRKNPFYSMIDCAYAHNTGIWHTTQSIQNINSFSIDFKWAEKWLNGCNTIYNGWIDNFKNKSLDYIEIMYEDIYNMHNAKQAPNLNMMFDYLGVTGFGKLIGSSFTYTNLDLIIDNVVNYDEVIKLKG